MIRQQQGGTKKKTSANYIDEDAFSQAEDEEGGTTSVETALGVPKGFRPIPRQATPQTSSFAALREGTGRTNVGLYYSRDITAPSSWASSAKVDWQMALVSAGLLDKKAVTLGVWDNATQKAYQQILELANQSGLTKEEALGQFMEGAAASAAAGFGPAGREAPVIQLTNPGELRETYREAYRSRVGKNPSEAAMNAFVDRFHQIESRDQRAYNDAAPGSTIVGPQSAELAARDQLRSDPEQAAEEKSYQMLLRMQDFYSMLDSPVQ
jgi:hypothetical protein